jgi:hypothetical protein
MWFGHKNIGFAKYVSLAWLLIYKEVSAFSFLFKDIEPNKFSFYKLLIVVSSSIIL